VAVTPLEIRMESGLEAAMRDGTILRADAYRPAGAGPWPVLLARTPYGRADAAVLARLNPISTAGRGYLVIVQDCRGRFGSDGIWEPLTHEACDGYDSVAWAARLPGSDGRVCMYGPSYLGHVQWAAIGAQPPALRAAVPEFTWADPHDGLISRGGVYELGLVTQWTLTLGVNVLERRHADRPSDQHPQLAELNAALEELNTAMYWELAADEPLHRLALPIPSASRPALATTSVPTLTVAGWFDCFLQGSLDNHTRARAAGVTADLIVGPWSHDNQTGTFADTDFGASAADGIDDGASLHTREIDWLDQQLNGRHTDEPPQVLVFVMGADQWRRLPSWPPESVQVPWYLRSDRGLSPEPPAQDSPPAVFHHDPDDPPPTHGGALLLPPRFPAGPLDQRHIEERDDVLTYTSEPLASPLEVIGRIIVHLAIDSTATTSHWVARLCDVDTDAVSRNITDGIARTNAGANEAVIDLWSTAHVFRPGHRLRVQITSGCFPRWQRNPSAARQSVYHDAARPSRIILPVMRTLTRPLG
jgi:putative CocE/NonD family hydrolase